MANRKVTLYVKSIKTVTGTQTIGNMGYAVGPTGRGRVRVLPDYKVHSEPTHGFALPEDQQEVVEIVKSVARNYDFEVKVIDITREGILQRAIKAGIEGIKVFSCLITDSGGRIEGNMAKQEVEFLLSKRRHT